MEQYARIRKTVEETEKERFEFEIEKFKKEQGRSLDAHKQDIDRLKHEKRNIQQEYQQQLEGLRKEMDRRLDKEKRDMQEQLRKDIDEVEKEEQAKYERKLEAMRREVAAQASAVNVEQEVQQYREQLMEEQELALRDYKRQLDAQMAEEEER